MRIVCIFLCFIAALQIGPKLAYIASVISSSTVFEGLNSTIVFTLNAWISVLDNSIVETEIFNVKDSLTQSTIALLKCTYPTYYTVCSSSTCISHTRNIEQYKWRFLSLAFSGHSLAFCSSDWETKLLTCDSQTMEISAFTETSVISLSSSSHELYDFQLYFSFLSSTELNNLLTQYTCHTTCPSCYGPSQTACNEFLPVVRLNQVLDVSSSNQLDYKAGSIPYRGRLYPSVTSIGTTGWFKTKSISNQSAWCEAFRLYTLS